MAEPKRVILRLSESDVNDNDLYEPVRAYLLKVGRSIEELSENRHWIHFQPSNAHIPQRDLKVHIVMDLEKDKFSGPIGDDFPHDFHRVHRRDGQL